MRSPEELSLIADIADDLGTGVWVATAPEGQFVYANRAFELIMGMGPVPDVEAGEYAEPYGIYTREGSLYPEERMPFVLALQARAAVTVDDIVIHRPDGGRVFVNALAKPMFDDAGVVTHIVIAFYDVTLRVEAEEGRARAEAERADLLRRELEARHHAAAVDERLQRLLANAPIILFAVDREGIITTSEGRGLERLGVRTGELLGQSVFETYASVPTIVDATRRALAGETVNSTNDLGTAVFDTWLAPFRDDTGEVIGAIGVATDITERRRLEGQLAQSERLASVGMLAAGVAHEINNPLSYVIGNLEILERAMSGTDRSPGVTGATLLDGPLRDARQGADRVRAIVRDLRIFSRVDRYAPQPIDLRGPLEASLKMAGNEIRHRARLVTDLSPVPDVEADEGRLAQLFLNLLVNAAHAIPEGAADDNEIRVTTRNDGEWVRVSVSDTGVGIARDVLPRIFDPFFTTKTLGAGTGLGLSICHAIVTELLGRIEVESEPGRGSTFRVLVPAARARTVSRPPPPARPAPARRASVLIIDDEPLLLRMLATLLASEHDVTSERRAADALARLDRGDRFDAILCDLMMPEVTGMDFYDRLVERYPDQAARVVFLTGGAFTGRARAFVAEHREQTLEKPFDAAALSARVKKAVGQS
jgi:PAS domain S-box-containing protein